MNDLIKLADLDPFDDQPELAHTDRPTSAEGDGVIFNSAV